MSEKISENSIKELIDSFIAYRNLIAPLQDSLNSVSKSYEEIRNDLDNLTKSFSGNAAAQLEKVHSTINAQAKSGQELGRKIEEYASSSERYAQAVNDMSSRFSDVVNRIDSLGKIEKSAQSQLAQIDNLISEKKSSYNLKELQRSLDGYNKNVEKISDFINKDIASVLKQNADKIETIRKENEDLSAAVAQQGKDIAVLITEFSQTSELLKKLVEGSSVNEEYLFDAFDKWAADRKVKIKKK
ncbi:MAG: hypothetical protein HFE33_01035 [Clostridia bacterium]|jgi:methyl-accepting chemotaxis protein|nr:hypothetical protein [Clostridia bacterium]MCI8944243.1 hypothetical protein [Clostridia bacterium]MCI9290453.1 hypothetical protein [Clostridia bacterium]MDE6885090.1 hypothetical protein [Clostridia bacterium]